MLVPFIEGLIGNARSSGALNEDLLRFEADAPTVATGELAYPGKVAIDGKRIAIADSGHHRVIIGEIGDRPDAVRVKRTVGGTRAGYADGAEPLFNSPQGLLFDGARLLAADAGNHVIRSIDIASGEASTVAGTGRQMRTRGDRDAGALSSPWDIAKSGDTLFAAMAGVHQIWSVNLTSHAARPHCGTGGEDIRDGDNRSALLAQPMGITATENFLYFADAESSAIRTADFSEDGSVRTIVGTGLFDFGDVDGTGDEVRLQHTQGIAVAPSGMLVVADSYNDCLKLIDPVKRTSRVWKRGLSEPSGVACSDTHAYVADTNAHRLVAVDLANGEMTEVRLE